MASQASTDDIVFHLKSVLLELNANPYPDVACPPGVPKRASIALIFRVQPNYAHWPESSDKHTSTFPPPSPTHRRRSSVASTHKLNFEDKLNAFFEQDWVKHGDPELLFIKRAARIGDKWNDAVTAMREALEEVGIDLSYEKAIAVGNLPQRIVTTSWGKVP
jgi:hypothetical protein